MELVYKKTYISKKEAMLRKNQRNIASFFCLLGKNYINTRFFYKRTEWEIFCSNVLVTNERRF